MQVYDACVDALTGAGLVVIPNCHILDAGWCCSGDDGSGLWYNDRWPEAKFYAAWQQLPERYRSNPLVAAAALMNAPTRSIIARPLPTPPPRSRPHPHPASPHTHPAHLLP